LALARSSLGLARSSSSPGCPSVSLARSSMAPERSSLALARTSLSRRVRERRAPRRLSTGRGRSSRRAENPSQPS
jgi:hypothetical protein